MLDDLDLTSIADPRTRELVMRLLNIIETLTADLRAAQVEIQQLRDEINRLKGEQGQPPIKPNTPPPPDHSSERERRRPLERVKRGKRDRIVIDRTLDLPVDPAILPPDAQFKGYEEVVVQDVVIRTDNVLFRKEKGSANNLRVKLPPGAAPRGAASSAKCRRSASGSGAWLTPHLFPWLHCIPGRFCRRATIRSFAFSTCPLPM
jgi:hypothetical protein